MKTYKNQRQKNQTVNLEEGWRTNVASAAMSALMAIASPASADTSINSEAITATLTIEGETKTLDLSNHDNVRDAERFVRDFMKKRGIMDYQYVIKGRGAIARSLGAGGLDFPERSTERQLPQTRVKDMHPVDQYKHAKMFRGFTGSFGDWLKANPQVESLRRHHKNIIKENTMTDQKLVFENMKFILFEKTVKEKIYKGYTIRIIYSNDKGYKGIAYREYRGKIDEFLVKDPKNSAEEVEKELIDYVDSKRKLQDNSLEQFKSGNITLFFNAPLSREYFGPEAVLYADVESKNGKPHLLISDHDQGGMFKVYDRNVNKRTGKGMAVISMPRSKAIKVGLTLSRYDLGKEIAYDMDDVKAFELVWHSDVLPDEPIRLEGPGLTVSPPKKGSEMVETELLMKTFLILEEFKNTQLLSELKKPSGTATIKFQIKPNGQLFAFVGLGSDPREIRTANAVIPETLISDPSDLSKLIQTSLKDPFYNFEKVKVIITKQIEKNYQSIISALDQSKERFGDRVEKVDAEPVPRGDGGIIRKKKTKISHEYKPYESPTKEFDPKNMRVKFTVSDREIERLFRSQGLNYQNGVFIMPYEQYKKLTDILKSPEMISRFGKRDVITNKTFIEEIDDDI